MHISLPTSSRLARLKGRRLPGWLRSLVLGIAIIGIWQLYVSLSGASSLLIASPAATAQALITDLKNGQLPAATLVSLQNLFIGVTIGIVIGLTLASLSAFSGFGRDLLNVLTAVFSPLPG